MGTCSSPTDVVKQPLSLFVYMKETLCGATHVEREKKNSEYWAKDPSFKHTN